MKSIFLGFDMRFDRVRGLIIVQIGAQVGNFAIQLVSVPAYIYAWTAGQYGVWLTLMAIPIIVSQMDVGFGAASAPAIAKAVHEARYSDARVYFWASFWATMTIGIGLVVIAALASILGLIPIVEGDQTSIVIFLSGLGIAVFAMIIRCFWSLLYALDRQFIADICVNGSFIFEGGVALVLLFTLRIEPAQLAIVMLALRFSAMVLMAAMAMPGNRWLWSFQDKQDMNFGSAIRELWKPATGYFVDPMSNLLQTQGTVFIVGNLVSPTMATVVYSHRLLTRVAWHLSGGVRAVTNGELMRLSAAGDKRFGEFALLTASVYFWTSFICFMGFVIFGPVVMQLWLGSKVVFDPLLFFMFALGSLFYSVLYAAKSVSSTENLHYKLSQIELTLSFIAALCIYAGLYAGMSVDIVGYVIMLLSLALCWIAQLKLARRFNLGLGAVVLALVWSFPRELSKRIGVRFSGG